MRKAPVIPGREVVRRLEKVGFELARQKGAHMILRREKPPRMTICVPDQKELKKKTLQSILHQVGLPRDEFEKLG